jgi:hypothetical protein
VAVCCGTTIRKLGLVESRLVIKERAARSWPGGWGVRKAKLVAAVSGSTYAEVNRFLIVKGNYFQISTFCQIVVKTGLVSGPVLPEVVPRTHHMDAV